MVNNNDQVMISTYFTLGATLVWSITVGSKFNIVDMLLPSLFDNYREDGKKIKLSLGKYGQHVTPKPIYFF